MPGCADDVGMEIKDMTPAEIDQLWIETIAPFNVKLDRARELSAKARKYRNYGTASSTPSADRYDAQAAAIREEIIPLRDEAEAPFLAEWNARGGWTRAYIVPDGHIHKTTACHTLHPTTRIAWLPEQSGLSEDEIVAAAGVHACTVCYPSAPVEALREAERLAKAATECPGSRGYDYTDFRRTSYTGSGRAKCNHCGDFHSVSKAMKMKAHPKKEA